MSALSSLQDNYSSFRWDVHPDDSDHNEVHEDQRSHGPIPQGARYFADSELQVLQSTAVPADLYAQGIKGRSGPGAAPSGAVPWASPSPQQVRGGRQPLFTLERDAHVSTAQTASPAQTSTTRGGDQVVRPVPAGGHRPARPLLQHAQHARSSRSACTAGIVSGARASVRSTHGDGKSHFETEHFWVTVTDFDYRSSERLRLPLRLHPVGRRGWALDPEPFGKYIADTNLLKSVAMKKQIDDFGALHAMVQGYVRHLGWRRGLTVSFPTANDGARPAAMRARVAPIAPCAV